MSPLSWGEERDLLSKPSGERACVRTAPLAVADREIKGTLDSVSRLLGKCRPRGDPSPI